MASAPQPSKKALELSQESLVELQTNLAIEDQPQLRIKEEETQPDTTTQISAAVKEELEKINESLSRITALIAVSNYLCVLTFVRHRRTSPG